MVGMIDIGFKKYRYEKKLFHRFCVKILYYEWVEIENLRKT